MLAPFARRLREHATELTPQQDVLPVSAIVKLADKTICCAVVGGKIEHRPIELGLRVGDEVEIVHGITDSDSIVLLRASSLQPGQAVEVIEKK